MKKFYFLFSFALFSLLVSAQSVINAKVVTFNIPGAVSTYITCTNDSNDFGGYYNDGTNNHGFIYFASAVDTIIVNYPGATNTRIFGINNNKVVVGAFNNTGNIADDKGFKYTHSSLTFAETTTWLSHQYKVSRDINDAGCIVGDHRSTPSTSICHILCAGNDTIFHYNYLSTFINRINNSNRAVGFWLDGSTNYGLIREPSGTLTALNYPGAQRTRLYGINDSNAVVGTFNLTHSFIYQNGVFKEVVKQGVSEILLQDINNYGLTVGYYKNTSGNYSGFYMPMCDIGFRPNPNGWQFNNSSANLWPYSYYSQIDYSSDPYRYGQAPFPTLTLSNGTQAIVQNFLFPDWKLFVETFGEDACYTVVNNIPVIKNAVFNKWYDLTTNWGGSCFGFTQSSFMAWDSMPQFKWHYPNVDPWDDYTYIYQIPINYHSRRCINQLQIKQKQKKYIRYYNQNANLSPVESLKKIKVRLLDGNDDEGGLVFFNQNGGGGHIVCPYKIEIDTIDPNIEYIYVYDNNQPNDTTRRVKVDKVKNAWYYNLSGNAAIAQSEWGGDNAHKGMYIFLPASELYAPSIYDSLTKKDYFGGEKNSTFEIYNSSGSNFIINNQSGQTTSFVNNVLTNDIPGAEPMFNFVGNEPPYGYLLNQALYNIEMKDFSDSLVSLSLITDNESYIYSRGNALLPQKDKFEINATGMKFINTDNISKNIQVHSISDDNGDEKSFFLYQMPLHSNSNLQFSILNNDKLQIVNEGSATSYNLKIQFVASSNTGIFEHNNITMDANTTHLLVVNWANIQNADVCIYIDNGNNGINDDTLCFNNQGTPIITTNPTQVLNSAALQTDTIFIGNLGSGTMPWTATSDVTGWLTISGSNTGSNFGYIKFTTTANTGAERIGHITFTSTGASNSPYVVEVKQTGVISVPSGLSASDGTFSDGVHLSWDVLSGATHYKVYRSSVAGQNGTALTGWITGTTYTDNTANGGDFYYFSVKGAQNASGLNESGFSNIDDGWRSCFTADFNYSGVCLGQPTFFNDMSSVHTNAYLLWDIDNNGTTDYTGTNIAHTYSTAGSKTVKLTVTDSSLCTNTITKTLTVLAFPVINLPDSTLLCGNQSVTLNAGSGFSSYLWSTGGTSASETVDSAGFGLGSFPVYVSVTNSNGCAKIDTAIVTWHICTDITTEKLRDFAVNVYPNPTNHELNIAIEGNINGLTLELYSYSGQLVYTQKLPEIAGYYNTVLDSRQYTQGVYFLRCVSEGKVSIKKLIFY